MAQDCRGFQTFNVEVYYQLGNQILGRMSIPKHAYYYDDLLQEAVVEAWNTDCNKKYTTRRYLYVRMLWKILATLRKENRAYNTPHNNFRVQESEDKEMQQAVESLDWVKLLQQFVKLEWITPKEREVIDALLRNNGNRLGAANDLEVPRYDIDNFIAKAKRKVKKNGTG